MGVALSVVVSCKGRFLEARQWIPSVAALLGAQDEIVLVDYDDPDGLSEWATGLHLSLLTVVRFAPAAWFQHNHARNIGCRVAVNGVLVQCDIDKLMSQQLVDECRAMRPGEFLVQSNETGSVGWVCLNYWDFLNVQGWEEAMCGYGHDDFYMRETLNKSGLVMRFAGPRVFNVVRENGCRIYPDERRHVSHHVNMRIGRSLRIYHPFRGNYARNWGAGGIIVCESEARRHADKSRFDLSRAWWQGRQYDFGRPTDVLRGCDLAVSNRQRDAAVPAD